MAIPGARLISAVAVAGALTLFSAPIVMAQCIDAAAGVPAVRLQAMGRGFNLAGQFDGDVRALLHEDLLRILHSRGMRHIRLPVPAESVMSAFSSPDVTERQLAKLTRYVGELIAMGYAVTIDLHPGDAFQTLHRTKPAEALNALKQAWASLAPVVRRFPPDKVFAELLNEPDVSPEQWRSDLQQLAAFVRQRLPETTLIVGPVNWQRADSLPGFEPLDDRNVIYAIHFYDPMAFTHQGHWNPNDPLSEIRDLPFPVRRDDPTVAGLREKLVAGQREKALHELDVALSLSERGDVVWGQLSPALEWRAKYRRPLVINEFGVFKEHAPRPSRARWLGNVTSFAEANCIGWSHWEFAQGFGLLTDDQKLDEPMVRALLRD